MARPIRHETVPIDDLILYGDNPRQGDIGVIAESLKELDQFRTVVVNANPDADTYMNIAAGNHTVQAAKWIGWDQIQVGFVELTDDEFKRVVLVDNRSNDLATYDSAVLVQMLEELAATDQGLAATGYDGDDLDTLLSDLSQSLSFEPEDEAAKLDELDGTSARVTCPNCAHEFTWGERKK